MPPFAYQGMQGQSRRDGELEASDRRAAISALRRMGILPVDVVEARGGTTTRRAAPERASILGAKRIRARDVTALTRQLATLTNAGFPLARALRFVQQQAENAALRDLVGHIDAEVRSGATLSDALAQHPRHFNGLYTSMVRAGEAGGILALLLERLAAMREADEALASKLKSAMTYPAIMFIAMLGSVVILFTFVVPKFATMFAEMGQVLPAPTRVMMVTSSVFENYWWAIGGLVAAVVIGQYVWGRTPTGRYAMDSAQLRLPVLGKFASQVAMARLCRTLGTLLDSGVSLIPALEASRGVAGNVVVSAAVSRSLNDIREGKKMGPTFAGTGVFPSLVCEMTSLGEESGQVGSMMLKVADVYDRETDDLVKALTSILEPVMILVMGGVVGFVVVAMLMPIFSMNLMGS